MDERVEVKHGVFLLGEVPVVLAIRRDTWENAAEQSDSDNNLSVQWRHKGDLSAVSVFFYSHSIVRRIKDVIESIG